MNSDHNEEAIVQYLNESASVMASCGELLPSRIVAAGELICKCLDSGGKVLVCGNGGSAADAQHLAAELTGRFLKHRRAFAAIALTTDTSAITSISNDYGFDHVFARQVEALGRAGDVLVAFSTSGKSPSIIKAIKTAKAAQMKVVGLTGQTGGEMPPPCDVCIHVPSDYTPHIQEAHGAIIHVLCKYVESSFGVAEA
jgi:D-sedoheptulose 7-phosphate isomerase